MTLAPQHVLVAVDLDELSMKALRKAAFTARTFGAKLDVVHVYSSSAPTPPIPLPGAAALHDEAARALRDDVAAKVRSMVGEDTCKGIDHEILVHHAPSPGECLCELATTRGADLMIVGSHQRAGLGRVFLGSVAEKVVRTAPCDVLVVRP